MEGVKITKKNWFNSLKNGKSKGNPNIPLYIVIFFERIPLYIFIVMDKKIRIVDFISFFENNKIGLTMYQIESGGKITIAEIQSRVTEQRTHLFNFTLHIHIHPSNSNSLKNSNRVNQFSVPLASHFPIKGPLAS